MPLRVGRSEALYGGSIDVAVVVVSCLELNDHVPLGLVIANARNVAPLIDVGTRKGVKRYGAVIFDLNGFRLGNLAYQD